MDLINALYMGNFVLKLKRPKGLGGDHFYM